MVPARLRSCLVEVPGNVVKWTHCGRHSCRLSVAFLLMLASVSLSRVYACGLEPALKGGFTVSYPGALDVAVAVADSRRSGLLPPATPVEVSSGVLLHQMLGDLERLQTRLNSRLAGWAKDSATAFSLVLVGPGLWSHYHPTPAGIRAEYHTDGPLAGKAVILTHHAVLRALLNGDLSTAQATELGLITYSGIEAGPVQIAFEHGFPPSS
jgi:hypothetical protein